MEDSNQNNNNRSRSNEEEIDLGQLFSLIGRGFSNFFGFIGNIFKAIFTWIVGLILLVRRNLTFILVGTIIGVVAGGIYQNFFYVSSYESSMNVKPNFGSTIQLYKNINYYQTLIVQQDYKRLSDNLGITEDEAKDLNFFAVEPYANRNQSIKAYGRFLSSLDSNVVNSTTLEEFIDNQPEESFEFHIVKVNSRDKFIFSKLKDPIIRSIENNDFYKTERAVLYENLLEKKKSIEQSVLELDTLRQLNKQIMITESEKEVGAGTNIYMSAKAKVTHITYKDYKDLNSDLISVSREIMSNRNVINVMSEFSSIGHTSKIKFINYYILGFLVGFISTFGVVILISLNRKLNKLEDTMDSK